jgi:hypothetical protein
MKPRSYLEGAGEILLSPASDAANDLGRHCDPPGPAHGHAPRKSNRWRNFHDAQQAATSAQPTNS